MEDSPYRHSAYTIQSQRDPRLPGWPSIAKRACNDCLPLPDYPIYPSSSTAYPAT
ncbi:hypothetical protein BofuT4_P016300.1 [Botrytis cinerea T4]|uniref:Uncharacterized protein n=1 Tax=Botryotinia fuckeliana (strain T4) TaxID=999810 RepID=G2YHY7_BOTF4|nr:hypothetical protein BofuT4_P016300.1 [Botrytis cinerea T4]